MSTTATKELRLRYNSEIGNTGTVAQDVVRYLKAIQENTAATNKALLEMGGAAGRGTESLRGMGAEGSRSIQLLARELGMLVAGLVSVGSAIAVVKKGFDFNSEIQQMQLGLSAIVAANEKVIDAQGNQIEGAQKLAYAQGQVAEVFAKLKQDAINTTATMPQLVGAFQNVLGPAMSIGMSLDDARKVTVQLVQAMGALGIPMDQARSEIGSLLQGTIGMNDTLAHILKIGNEDVKLWTQKGTLAQELLKRTEAFGEAGKQAGEIWNGAISNLGDNLQQKVLGPLTGEAFKTATDAVKRLNAEAFDDETLNRAVRWGRILNDGVTAALIGSEAVGRLLLMGADGFLAALEKGKRWAAEVGVNQAKKEMRGQLLDQLGLNPMQRWELGWNTDAKDPSSMLIRRAGELGLSSKQISQLSKGLVRIDKASSAELERFDHSQSQGVMDQMAAERARIEAVMQGRVAEFLKKGQGTKLDGFDLAQEQFDHGKLGLAAYLKAARAEQAKFNADTKEYWELQDKIDGAQKKQLSNLKQMKAQGSELGPARVGEVYGPEQIVLPAPDYKMHDVPGLDGKPSFEQWKAQKQRDVDAEVAKNQALVGTEQDPLVKGMRAYQEWKEKEGEKLAQEIASMIGGLASGAISNGGLSMGSILRGIGGAASMFGGPVGMVAGIGLDLFASSADRADAAKAKAVQENDANARRSRWLYTSMMGIGSGPEATRDRALIGLGDEAENLRKNLGLTAEQMRPYLQAKEHEIKATYEAAKALEGVQKASSKFDAHLNSADIREQLGLGKKTSADVLGALRAGGIQGNLGVLGDADFQKTVLSYYDTLAKNSTASGGYDPNAADPNDFYRKYFQNKFGLDLGQSNMSNNAVLELFKSTLIPALLDLKQLGGGAALGSIGGAGTDTALQFDAPQTRMITNNNAITVNTLAVTGDKASVRELARVIANEMSTMASQAV